MTSLVVAIAISSLVAKNRRATAYGIFNTGFGVFWFLGSWVMGAVYDVSLPLVVGISMAFQLLSIPFLFRVKKEMSGKQDAQL